MATVTTMSTLEDVIPNITSQVEGFRRSDKAREDLLQDIIVKFENLLKENIDLNRDLNGEKLTRRVYQDQVDRLSSQLSFIDNTSFVLALIDGDGVIFQDMFLKAAAEGGSTAASKLHHAIQEHIASLYDNSKNWAISVNIYVSLDKLGQKLAQVGLLKHPQEFRAFVQGFNVNQPLFNFVDVGHGKERADNKLRETLRSFIDNPTCKHIIFGGCHDAGYLNNLEPYKHDDNKASRITLLESTPYYPGFTKLPSSFKRAKFDGVFKSDPLPEFGPPVQPSSTKVPTVERSVGISRTVSNKSASPTNPTRSEPTPAVRSPSNTSLTSGGSEFTQGSWATVGKKDEGKSSKINVASKKNTKKKKYAYYNKDGHRLDEPLPVFDKTAGDSIKMRMQKGGKNLCNNFHLNKGECNNQWCPFQHEPNLSAAELNALRWKARTLACKNRYCENLNCYLGHQCMNERDRGHCSYENDCHFKNTHGMDQVKHEQWDEDGNVVKYK